MRQTGVLVVVGGLFLFASSCGPKAFTKGDYDDPNRIELLDDKWNEADMQTMSGAIVDSMLNCEDIKTAKKKPVVIVEQVQNRTEEHIDMKSMTDMIRTALTKSKKVKFVNKEERGTLDDEYTYNEKGNTSEATRKKRGKQTGADYIMSGEMSTNVQEVGNDKYIYYKLTMNLTNLENSEIDCTEDHQIRKKYRKRTVGL